MALSCTLVCGIQTCHTCEFRVCTRVQVLVADSSIVHMYHGGRVGSVYVCLITSLG